MYNLQRIGTALAIADVYVANCIYWPTLPFAPYMVFLSLFTRKIGFYRELIWTFKAITNLYVASYIYCPNLLFTPYMEFHELLHS